MAVSATTGGAKVGLLGNSSMEIASNVSALSLAARVYGLAARCCKYDLDHRLSVLSTGSYEFDVDKTNYLLALILELTRYPNLFAHYQVLRFQTSHDGV